MAKESAVSAPTVQRIWQAFGLQPHRQGRFKISPDHFFVEKVRDIVGLYLNPPENAMVLCVDEKSQIQALERTQPVLPMGLVYVEGVTHDYIRHGTLTLFAALDIASGQVLTKCKKRHRHQDYLDFLKHIDANVPPELDVHLTPTYASWLNQVEIWFNVITQQAIRRGTLPERQGPGRDNRSLRSSSQRSSSTLHLDRHRRFHPGQDQKIMSIYFRDATLEGFIRQVGGKLQVEVHQERPDLIRPQGHTWEDE
jgi:transposase